MARPKKGGDRPKAVTAQILGNSDIDLSLFTAEELAEIEAEAEKEATASHRAKARKRLIEAHKAAVLKRLNPAVEEEEDFRDILIDLAPHADRIILDGTMYMHGLHYTVSRAVYDTMKDIMARTWEHEDDTGHANRTHYRKPREVRIGPQNLGQSAASIMRI